MKMTGFEQYLQRMGFVLTGGSEKEFSTYDNCARVWTHFSGKIIVVGLKPSPTHIAICNAPNWIYDAHLGRYRWLTSEETILLDSIPDEEKYEEIIKIMLNETI